MDKLIRISLVNWYLFGAEDIPINGDVILFRGANGAGKSSLLDAMQALFAGGDENELLMNAASSDGRRSGRSLRSYVLGMVSDAAGDQSIPSRKESSSYIVASFKRSPDRIDEEGVGEYYSIGLALHAKQSDQRVIKHRFILEGRSFTTDDAVTADGHVRPWKVFEKYMLGMPGRVYLPTTAAEFRHYAAQLMSADAPDQKIQPNAMLRALKKGIGFKEQKCISQFTRDHVLPENSIDVLRVQNDYEEYRRIYDLMEEAKHRLHLLHQIIGSHEKGVHHLQQVTAYDWCFHHVRVESLRSQLRRQKAIMAEKQGGLSQLHVELELLNTQTQSIQNARDEALSHFRQTDHFSAIKSHDDQIAALKKAIAHGASVIGSTKSQLQRFAHMQSPKVLSNELRIAYADDLQVLQDTLDIKEDLLSHWPKNASHISHIREALDVMGSYESQISSERDRVKTKVDQVRERLAELESAVHSAKSGQAKLHDSTEQVIALLAEAGIEAKPVCELARISDPDWQIGVERFLGSNREALVVESKYYEEALKVYRRAKDQRESLRAVKLVNPDKGFGFTGKPEAGTAAALIFSDNEIAQRFLRGLVHNVELVETESELRKAKRAITKDGMVAGNGAISGGNMFRWVLIGQDARRGHAEGLARELIEAQTECAELEKQFGPLETFNREFLPQLQNLQIALTDLGTQYKTVTQSQDALEVHIKEREALHHSPNAKLEAEYESSNQALIEHQSRIRALEIRLSSEQRDLERLNHSIPEVEKNFGEASDSAEKVQEDEYWNEEVAHKTYEELKKAQNVDDQQKIDLEQLQRQALEGKKACASLGQKALMEGSSVLTEYLTRYEPEDRNDFASFNPEGILARCQIHRDQIQETQMLVYLEDAKNARETMLENFRFEVVAKLKDAFETIKSTFKLLNKQLKELTFNNTQYQFIYPLVETPVLKSVYEYVIETTAADGENVGTLFDEQKNHPGVKIIEEVLLEGRLSEISDYRNFFTYDIVATDRITGLKRYFSELLLNGSGGEKQTPFYVALGASFMTAFKIHKNGDQLIGGVGLALFDEAFSKMDGNNAQTALSFFKDIGLQVILAAPPDSEVKVGPFVDATFTILRSGAQVYLDHKRFTPEGKALLRSDEPARVYKR
ncbi:MAG TPA: hypothetical protein DHW71_02725 [Gammaproteobacteria bacterium]|nr:hypothetical protein [Chloroflexota bacterium]HBF09881.1 hypothetical protein [Gammaproteobacteria bacterium]HCK91870.1 hypothetical protein [Gammaproteobacteria bacterium]|tara:strand:+ start:13789 stop:17211 length:3423 start_codon:yes stop_codon:yes gene_type:complete